MINVAVLMGRLVADPELRHTPSDIPVTTIRIAVDRRFNKAGGEKQTDFIDVTAWRQTADFICRCFRKGSMIAVQGSIRVENYTDRDGNKRSRFEVVADNVSFCGSKQETTGGPGLGTPVTSLPPGLADAYQRMQNPAPAHPHVSVETAVPEQTKLPDSHADDEGIDDLPF